MCETGKREKDCQINVRGDKPSVCRLASAQTSSIQVMTLAFSILHLLLQLDSVMYA